MEKEHKRHPISLKKRILLIADGVLLVALLAAIVVLAVRLTGGNVPEDERLEAANPEQTPAAEIAADAVVTPEEVTAPVQTPVAQQQTGETAQSQTTVPDVDFAALDKQGISAIAYLFCAGTPIDYPVVQTVDNETYMEKNAKGKRDPNGAIYLDCRNSATLADAQNMIYGNPMADGTMFGSLINYNQQAYLDLHPVMTLVTPEKKYTIDIFAAHTASPAMSNYPTWFENDQARTAYLDSVKAQSVIQSSITIQQNDQLICLVTSSDFDAGEQSRFVVHGVLREITA